MSKSISAPRLRLSSLLRILVAIIVTLIMFFPVYWMLISSVKTGPEMRLAVPTLWPQAFQLSNYVEAFQKAPRDRFFLNTVTQTGVLLILQPSGALTPSYSCANAKDRGRGALVLLVL